MNFYDWRLTGDRHGVLLISWGQDPST